MLAPDGLPEKRVIYQVVRPSECSECGTELDNESLMMMEAGQPLCVACAGFADLEFLRSGDSALTRRAVQGSIRQAEVVRFSPARKRYELQGVLVEPMALEKAERACELDAEERAVARTQAAVERLKQDRSFARRLVTRIQVLFPRCPPAEVQAVAEFIATRGGGTMAKPAEARKIENNRLTMAVAAAIRHRHTNYQELLARGFDRNSARHMTFDRVEGYMSVWQGGASAAV